MALSAVVVVPARDEADRIAGCLGALAAQTIGRRAFRVIVVPDGCADDTAQRARAAGDALGLGLDIVLLQGPDRGPGAARRLGMERAADDLLAAGSPSGLIATTDADSEVAPDWLARQIAHLSSGVGAVAGRIELIAAERAQLPEAVLARRERDAATRLRDVRVGEPTAEHHHFAGASIGVSAAAYRQVGGMEPLTVLEDAAFATRLRSAGVVIRRAADVRVSTSARSKGRVDRGLSVDLAVSLWRERNRFTRGAFDPVRLAEIKAETEITVIILTRLCADTIGAILTETVAPLRRAGLVDRVIVIDAASADETATLAARAGAEILQQDAVQAGHGPALGRGDAMWRALSATTGDLVCFLDGTTADPCPDHLLGLIGPLLTRPELALVKGAFACPRRAADPILVSEGDRVTELMARPLLNLHVPRLAGFAQPLTSEFAARRELLEAIPFPVGDGIEIAILIDALRRAGLEALAESDLGPRVNREPPLRDLGEVAFAVLAAVEKRRPGGRMPDSSAYLRPWTDGTSVPVAITERPPLATLGHVPTA